MQVNDRVRVYWADEEAYFYGRIIQEKGASHVRIEYDDGDIEWEERANVQVEMDEQDYSTDGFDSPPPASPSRYHDSYADDSFEPATEDSYDTSFEPEDEERVEVYWEEERCWFPGSVVETDPSRGLLIRYDDGDEGWESLSSGNIRYIQVLTPRPYVSVGEFHLQPIIVSRKYQSVSRHCGSILQPRDAYQPVAIHSFMECQQKEFANGLTESQTQTMQ